MGQALHVSVELTTFTCGKCGGVYAITERVREFHHLHGSCWNCPYCQVAWGYPNAGTLAAAQRELAEEKQRHSRTLARLATEEAAGRKLTRKLKRVEKGVCPECNRTFVNLAKHMHTQHAKGGVLVHHVGPALLPGK